MRKTESLESKQCTKNVKDLVQKRILKDNAFLIRLFHLILQLLPISMLVASVRVADIVEPNSSSFLL
jgi:hypothetical protein